MACMCLVLSPLPPPFALVPLGASGVGLWLGLWSGLQVWALGAALDGRLARDQAGVWSGPRAGAIAWFWLGYSWGSGWGCSLGPGWEASWGQSRGMWWARAPDRGGRLGLGSGHGWGLGLGPGWGPGWGLRWEVYWGLGLFAPLFQGRGPTALV